MGRTRRTWMSFLKHTVNPVTLRMAASGRGPFSLVRHVGRRTGTVHETPIMVAPVPEGFIAELTYGDRVDWYRNIVAAGGCELVVKGVTHQVVAVEPYPADAGRAAFGYPARLILQLLHRHEFRLLRTRA